MIPWILSQDLLRGRGLTLKDYSLIHTNSLTKWRHNEEIPCDSLIFKPKLNWLRKNYLLIVSTFLIAITKLALESFTCLKYFKVFPSSSCPSTSYSLPWTCLYPYLLIFVFGCYIIYYHLTLLPRCWNTRTQFKIVCQGSVNTWPTKSLCLVLCFKLLK